MVKDFEVKYLSAEVGVMYWEDASVDGDTDVDGKLIPCREGDYWKPIIELETGKIINWEMGKTAQIHYKSCDDNVFSLLDEKNSLIAVEEGYVISSMCPIRDGYGDYVIMDIDSSGTIHKWKFNPSDFEHNDE